MRSRNIQLGINGERFVFSLFERTIGKKRLEKGWYQIKHQDWDNNYNYGTGVDIGILEDDKPLIDIEVKNFKKQSRPYGTDIALKEVIPRFDGSTAPIRLLFISFVMHALGEVSKYQFFSVPINRYDCTHFSETIGNLSS